MFLLVYVQVRQRGAWKLHLYNSDAQMLFILQMHNLATFSNLHFLFWLVISTVSSLASKHFCSFAQCPYHTRMVNVVTCYHNTHHPHHFKLQEHVLFTLFLFGLWQRHHHCPWVFWSQTVLLQVI